ncbi:hypothetical protein [Lactococcus lactis]
MKNVKKKGTLFLRQKSDLIELEKLAIERKKEAPEMGMKLKETS